MDSGRLGVAQFTRSGGLYLVHVFIGTAAVFLITTFIGAGITHLSEKMADRAFGGPAFLAYIVFGFFGGLFINRHLRSDSAKWAWIPWTLVILFDFYSYRKFGWEFTFSYLFGPPEGAGVEQVFTVAPFYSSIAYSLGAWAALWRPSMQGIQTGRKE